MKFERDIEIGKHKLAIKSKKENVLIYEDTEEETIIWLFDKNFDFNSNEIRELERISPRIRWFTYEKSVEFVVPVDVFWEEGLLKYAKSKKWISYKERIYPKDKRMASYDPNPQGFSIMGNIFRKIKVAKPISIRKALGVPTSEEWESSNEKGFIRKKDK